MTKPSSQYQSERNKIRRAWVEEHGLPDWVEHGASAYTNWGCHCDICKAAHAEYLRPYQRAWYLRKKEETDG